MKQPTKHGDIGAILDRLADEVLEMDQDELEKLLPRVQARMESPEPSRQWQRSVIAFFLINGIRATQSLAPHARRPPVPQGPPKLRVVK